MTGRDPTRNIPINLIDFASRIDTLLWVGVILVRRAQGSTGQHATAVEEANSISDAFRDRYLPPKSPAHDPAA